MRDGLGIDRVACATDVKAATLAELRWGALRGADPGVFLNARHRPRRRASPSAAACSTGANGAAGEIGYAARAATARRADGGPLEERVGGRALGERGGARSAAAVSARADAGDRSAARLVDEALDELAVHVANLADR